jgi:hydroxymethylpyrimidine/phosphomethylpyrimidine kinase
MVIPSIRMSGVPPVVLSIAGSDSGAGAGLQADLKTCAALGGYAVTVVSAVTAQNSQGVQHVEPVSAQSFAAQLNAVFSDVQVQAVKIGMIPNAQMFLEIAHWLRIHPDVPVVVDPVGRASTGARLGGDGVADALRSTLAPLVTLITPNVDELRLLAGAPSAQTEAELVDAAEHIRTWGVRYVLAKGGHRSGGVATDLLIGPEGVRRFCAPRIERKNNHGTGCTLATAIATQLARGWDMAAAVGAAKRYLSAILASSDRHDIGRGHGPMNHFAPMWPAWGHPLDVHDPSADAQVDGE